MPTQLQIDKGSQTAKDGFKMENEVISKFNNWRADIYAQNALTTMGYNLVEIENVIAQKVPARQKSDVQVLVTVFVRGLDKGQNISVKLVSKSSGFNQIERGWVKKYVELWNIPINIAEILEHFAGQTEPKIENPKDLRRMFLNEFTDSEQKLVVDFFEKNRLLILSDIIKGRGIFAAEWMLVVHKMNENISWTLKYIKEVLNIFNQGKVEITGQGSLKIGKVGLQRKGGDGGRNSANQLQFKIDPTEIAKTNSTF